MSYSDTGCNVPDCPECAAVASGQYFNPTGYLTQRSYTCGCLIEDGCSCHDEVVYPAPPWALPSSSSAPIEGEVLPPLTAGDADYYDLWVSHPTDPERPPYLVKCNDIIESLQMTYAEGNTLKAVWRHALARRGIGKRGNTQRYEAEKIAWFGKRLVAQASITQEENRHGAE